MYPDIPEEQVRGAVELVAMEALKEAGIYQPPVNAISLAESLGMRVVAGFASGARAKLSQLVGEQPMIVVAEETRPERRQWAVAHEVGEALAYRVFGELGIEGCKDARERIASRLAGCTLLPRDWFAADGATVDWDLAELKAIYSTASNALIADRMLDMPPAVILTVVDQGKVCRRRNNRGLRVPPMSAPEIAVWKIAHEQGQPARGHDFANGIEDLRAWPVHEPHFKREIVRTEITEY